MSKTTSVIGNDDSNNYINIPYSIQYRSYEYVITNISDRSLVNSRSIKIFEFSVNFQIQRISKSLFHCSSIESITIPSSVILIYKYSFYSCGNQHQINFSNNSNFKKIDKYAFSKTSIKSIFITSSVKIIYGGSFFCCCCCHKLQQVEFLSDSK